MACDGIKTAGLPEGGLVPSPESALACDCGASFQAQALMYLAAPTPSFWNNPLGRSQVPCLLTLRRPCSEEAPPRHVERLRGETERRLASPSSSLCPSPGPDMSVDKPCSRSQLLQPRQEETQGHTDCQSQAPDLWSRQPPDICSHPDTRSTLEQRQASSQGPAQVPDLQKCRHEWLP